MTSALVTPDDVSAAEGLSDKPLSTGALAWRRFRKHRLAMLGAIGLVLLVVLFFLGPQFSDYALDERNVRDRLQGPSWAHPFGTDPLGRDLFVRMMSGGQYSLRIGLLVAVLATAFGTLMGALAGFFGRWIDIAVSQVINLVLVVPYLIVLVVFAQELGKTPIRIALMLSALLWTRIARVSRGVIMQIREQEFVQAARASGARAGRIIGRHLLPNVIGPVVVEVTLLLGTAIVLESTLSFLGLGPQPPAATLGKLIYDEKGNIDNDPVRVLIPAFFIVAITLCVNFLGDGLRDALDPKTKVEKG